MFNTSIDQVLPYLHRTVQEREELALLGVVKGRSLWLAVILRMDTSCPVYDGIESSMLM